MARSPADDESRPTLDPAELAEMVASLRNGIRQPVDPAALAAAQEIMDDAWEAESAEQAVAHAMKAISASPHCCDAYTLIGSIVPAESDDALALLELALEAGEKVLGPAVLEDPADDAWESDEGQAYLRARLALAQSLWMHGRHDDAVAHYRALLDLDPGDAQGVRNLLAAALLELDRDDDLAALLEAYADDDGAEWTWTRLLAALRAGVDEPTRLRLLRAAADSNGFVPDMLLGNRPMPDELPDEIEAGGEDEAAAYAESFGAGWVRTKGALAWLAKAWARIKPAG